MLIVKPLGTTIHVLAFLLLRFIKNSRGMITHHNIICYSEDEFDTVQKKAKLLKHDEIPLTLPELATAIIGKHSIHFKFPEYSGEVKPTDWGLYYKKWENTQKMRLFPNQNEPDATKLSKSIFTDRALRPLLQFKLDIFRLSLNADEKKKLHELTYSLCNELSKFFIENLKPVNRSQTPIHSPERVDKTGISQVITEKVFLEVMEKFRKTFELLQDHKGDQYLSMRLRLNDILVRFLAFCAKYNMIKPFNLEKFLNDEDEGQAICNYVLGMAPLSGDVYSPNSNISFDLRLSLQESSLTEDIHVLLEKLTPETWAKIMRLEIGCDIIKSSWHSSEFKNIKQDFLWITSTEHSQLSNKAATDIQTELFMERLLEIINMFMLTIKDLDEASMKKIKLLHKIMTYMVDNHVKASSIDTLTKIENLRIFPRIRAFDEAMWLFSDSLKSIYAKYGQVLQIISLEKKHIYVPKDDIYSMLCLADINHQDAALLFSEIKIQESIPRSSYNQNSSKVDIEFHNTAERFEYLINTWNEEVIPSKKMELIGTDHESNNDIEKSPFITQLKQRSKYFFEMGKNLKKKDSKLRLYNTSELLELESGLRNILKNPFANVEQYKI